MAHRFWLDNKFYLPDHLLYLFDTLLENTWRSPFLTLNKDEPTETTIHWPREQIQFLLPKHGGFFFAGACMAGSFISLSALEKEKLWRLSLALAPSCKCFLSHTPRSWTQWEPSPKQHKANYCTSFVFAYPQELPLLQDQTAEVCQQLPSPSLLVTDKTNMHILEKTRRAQVLVLVQTIWGGILVSGGKGEGNGWYQATLRWRKLLICWLSCISRALASPNAYS